jgi:hypothetical protein
MATREQIAAAILDAAGRPESGWIAENAGLIADKIVSLDNVSSANAVAATDEATREKRVTEIAETR